MRLTSSSTKAIPGTVKFPQIPELAERGMQRIGLFFDLLEKRLSESPYLAGDAFPLADITCFVLVDFARVVKRRIPEENSATQDWFDKIKARPSASL